MTTSALLLAAGSSTRLRPLTASLPKCLLPVGGKPIIAHQLEALVVAGIQSVTIVVGFEKEQIIQYVNAQHYPLAVSYIHNDAYQTTGPILGGLLPAIEQLHGSLLFFHCDVLFTDAAVTLLLAQQKTAMLYRAGVWDEEAGKVTLREDGYVAELGKHISEARATGEYLQIAKFESSFCDMLRDVIRTRAGESKDGYTIDAFNDVIALGGEAFGIPFTGTALEIDTPEDYRAAEAVWNQMSVQP